MTHSVYLMYAGTTLYYTTSLFHGNLYYAVGQYLVFAILPLPRPPPSLAFFLCILLSVRPLSSSRVRGRALSSSLPLSSEDE